MSIIVSQNGKNAKRIEKSAFDSEDSLQEYIYNNPEVIPIDEIEDGLKLFIAAREFQVGSGRIDALGFDQRGNIYVIETKLARNSDKREVVAQVLDYGAALWGNLDAQTFFDSLSEYTKQRYDKTFSESLADYYALDNSVEILDQIKNNLASGNIRFIVMMDEIEPHLKDLVRFINQNSKYDVYALETSMYKDDNREIMITQIFGDEIKKEPRLQTKSEISTWTPCKEEDFVRSICARDCEPELKEQILKFAGILKNINEEGAGNVDYYRVKSIRLDTFRICYRTFYCDDSGRINVFITSPEYHNSKMADYFRQVWKEIKKQDLFNVDNPDEHRTLWFVPAKFTLDQYKQFVDICEKIAREMKFISDYSERDFRKFVDGSKWVVAKTYEQSSPHEYIIINPNDSRRKEFTDALKFLFENGVREAFYQKSYMRYILDNRKYWSMEQSFDEVDDETIVLNRTRPENTYTIYE